MPLERRLTREGRSVGNRFEYRHPEGSERFRLDALTEAFDRAAEAICVNTAVSRAQSIALTQLQLAMNAAFHAVTHEDD